jgi:hypothetical protein
MNKARASGLDVAAVRLALLLEGADTLPDC